MSRLTMLCTATACFAIAAGATGIHAGGSGGTLVVTMTNDPDANQINVYDAGSHVLLQTLSTHGKGGVGGNAIAANIATGGAPADIDADSGLLGVIDHGAGQSHLSLFSYNQFGELAPAGPPITVDVADANGVAILAPRGDDRN